MSLTVICTPEYPSQPPQVRFTSAVALDCVDGAGAVDLRRLPGFSWHRDSDIKSALVAVRNSMMSGANRRRDQPPEGATY